MVGEDALIYARRVVQEADAGWFDAPKTEQLAREVIRLRGILDRPGGEAARAREAEKAHGECLKRMAAAIGHAEDESIDPRNRLQGIVARLRSPSDRHPPSDLQGQIDELVAALDRAHSRILTFDTMATNGNQSIPRQHDVLDPLWALIIKHREVPHGKG